MRTKLARAAHYLAARLHFAYPDRVRFRLAQGPLSVYRLAQIEKLNDVVATPPDGGAPSFSVRLRPLRGQRVILRACTTDYEVLQSTLLRRNHLPPTNMVPRTILDLGANIGLTMAHYAVLYPSARIMGVELDPANYALCQQNIRPFEGRCVAVCAAVWSTDGQVAYSRRRGNESGFAVGSGDVTAPALTINSLLAQSGWDSVDFVKMDIEGAEQAVLRDTDDWAAKVGCISVEVHPPYTVEQCERHLQEGGFRTVRLPTHVPAVLGNRPGITGA